MNTDKLYAERIATEYAPKKTRKVIALKKLHTKAKKPAQIVGISVGLVSLLFWQVGTALILGMAATHFDSGIAMSIVGAVGSAVAPILYQKIWTARKMEYGTDILILAQEVIEDSNSIF